MIFETKSKFVVVFARLILGKVGIDGFTRPQRKINISYEFGLKVFLKGLGCKKGLLQPFLIEFLSNN